eukprot:EG_transcript_17936
MEATTKRSSSPPLLRWPDDEQSIFYLTVPDKWTPEMEAFAGSFSTATGAEAVIEHCCAVAAGLTGADGRPYNPFSARDAHVMLQLKRTLEAVASPPVSGPALFVGLDSAAAQPAPCGPQLGLVLRAALAAGKAARDPSRVPAIAALRGYGGEGRYSVPISAAPARVRAAAEEAAWSEAVRPAVEGCAAQLAALRHSQRVAALRQSAEQLANAMVPNATDAAGAEVRRAVNRVLHPPTLALRQGLPVDE